MGHVMESTKPSAVPQQSPTPRFTTYALRDESGGVVASQSRTSACRCDIAPAWVCSPAPSAFFKSTYLWGAVKWSRKRNEAATRSSSKKGMITVASGSRGGDGEDQ